VTTDIYLDESQAMNKPLVTLLKPQSGTYPKFSILRKVRKQKSSTNDQHERPTTKTLKFKT